MKKSIRIRLLGVAAAPLFLLAACSDPGPAEQAGEQIDEAVEDVRETLDPAGPAERTGREIDDAVENVTEN